nr:hypothetical protein [Tanacetum cinerariifolium]
MSTPKFADVHNMVTFLSKPTESEGFEQIIDFLNANPIKYALTVNPTIYTLCIEQLWITANAKNINGEAQIHAKVDGKKKKQNPRNAKHKETQETQPSDPTHEALNKKNVHAQSNDPPLLRINTFRSREDSLKLNELMKLCTKLSNRVLNMEITKISQAKEILSLKKRVKRLEKKKRPGTHGLKRLYKVGLSARVESSDEEQSLDINAATTTVVTTATTTAVSIDDITLAQALVEIKTSNPKARGVVIFDEQEARRLQAEIDEQNMLVKEKPQQIEDEILAWDNVQAMMDANYELAARLQEEEQGELAIKEKSRLFVELIDKRKKHFEKLRAKEQRRKPPTKAQKRNQIADGNSQMYYTFSKMLKNFNREDLEVLWRLFKDKFEKVQPVDEMVCYLLHTLKTMFEHHVEDTIWKSQQGLTKVKNGKLIDSCGVHCVSMQNTVYYLLVEKMYPLTNHTLHQMFNNVKLQVDEECEMAYELLRLVKKQLKE